MSMGRKEERHVWLFLVLQLSVVASVSSLQLVPQLFNGINSIVNSLGIHTDDAAPSGVISTSSSGSTSSVKSTSSGELTTSAGLTSSGGVSASGDSTSGIEYYDVEPKFVEIIDDVRKSATSVHLKVQPQTDGSLSVTLTTDKGSKTYNKISKATLSLFVKLIKNPTLQIKQVGTVGSKVKIQVSPEPPKPTNIIKVKPEFLDVIKQIQDGGYSINIKQSDDKYTITITDSEGKVKTYSDVSSSIGQAFIRLVKDPQLQYQVLGKSGDKSVIFIPDFSGSQKSFNVKPLFLTLLKQVKKYPDHKIQIKTGTDGKYELVIHDENNQPKTYKHIDPDLLYVFVKLIKNPNLQFKVSPADNGKLTITLEDTPKEPNTQVIDNTELLTLIEKAQKDPSYNLRIDTGKNGLELIITHGDKVTKYPLPPQFLNIVIRLITSKKPPKTETNNGQTTVILPDVDDDDQSKTIPIKVDIAFINLISDIKKNPKAEFKFKVEPDDNGKYTLIFYIDGKPKVLKDLPHDAIQFLIKYSQNPKSPIHIVEEKPEKPEQEIIDLINDIPKKPNAEYKFQVEPDNNGKYTIKFYIDGKPKVLKDQPQDAIQFLIKYSQNPKSPIHIVEEKPQKPEQEIIDLINDIPKNPNAEYKFQVKPDDNGKYTIIFYIDGKPKVLTDQPHDAIQFLIKYSKNPKSPIHIVEEKPEKPKHEKPEHEKPEHKKPEHEKHEHKKPEHEKPEHEKPEREKPEHEKPEHEKPEHEKPEHEKPEHKKPEHEKPEHKKPEHEKPEHKIPEHEKPEREKPEHEKPEHEKPEHKKPEHEKPEHEKPEHEKPEHEKPEHEKPEHEKPDHEKPEHEKPEHEKPEHKKPGKKEPSIHILLPGKNTNPPPITTIPKDQLELTQTIKSAPKLSISVTPNGPNFKITVTDGLDTKTYPDITPEFLLNLITIRNQQDLPFEITPSKDPSKVNINVPNQKKPDIDNIDVDISYLKPLHVVREEPDSEIDVKPDNEGTYTVTIKPKDGKKPYTLKHVQPNVLHLISKLKTSPNVGFTVKSDKPGKITLVVPKQQSKPVHVKLTPDIIDLLKNIRSKPEPKVSIKPEKPGTYTIVVDNDKGKKEYPHISPELVPIIIKLFSEPSLEYEIKPGKDNTLKFVPSQPSPDSHRYKVKPDVLDIIHDIKKHPATEIHIKPGPHNTYTIETKEPHQKPKTYPNVDQDSLDLIINLKSHPDQTFTVKPTDDGDLYIIVPKPNTKGDNVPISPDVLDLIKLLHTPEDIEIHIKPQKDGKYTIFVHDGKKTHDFPNIPRRLLPVILKLYRNPHRHIHLKPTIDDHNYGNVPEDIPKSTHVTLNKDDVELIHHAKRQPSTDVTLKHSKKNGLTVEVGHGPHKKEYPHVSPKVANIVVKLLTQPKLPFHIYTGRDGRNVLVTPIRPKDSTVPDVPKDLIEYIEKHRYNPHLEVHVTKGKTPDNYDVTFQDRKKPIKLFKNLNPKTVQLTVELFNTPETEYRKQPQPNGKLSVKPSRDNVPTVDVQLDPNDLPTLENIRNPDVDDIKISPSKIPHKFKIVLDDKKKPITVDDISPLFLNFLIRLQTEPQLPVNVAVDEDGHLVAIAPKRVSHNVFHDVDSDVLKHLNHDKPNPKDTTFSIKPDKSKPDSYNLEINNKRFPHVSPNTVQLAILLISQPELHTRVLNERNGKLTIQVTTHRPNLVFTNVNPSFVKISQIVRHNPEVYLSVHRKPNKEIDVVITNGPNQLKVANLHPLITQLFVALFSRPDFPYNFYLDQDNSITFVVKKDSLNPRFSHIKPGYFDYVKKVRVAKVLEIVVKHEDSEYEVEVSINGAQAKIFKVTHEELQLIILFVTYPELQFTEEKGADGLLEIPVIIKSKSSVINFELLTAATIFTAFPEVQEEELVVPVIEPEIRLKPHLTFEPKIELRPELTAKVGFKYQLHGIVNEFNYERRDEIKDDLKHGRLEAKFLKRPYLHESSTKQGHELYYKLKNNGAYGYGNLKKANRFISERLREF